MRTLGLITFIFCCHSMALASEWLDVKVSLYSLPYKQGKALVLSPNGQIVIEKSLVLEALTLDHYILSFKDSKGVEYTQFEVGECQGASQYSFCHLKINPTKKSSFKVGKTKYDIAKILPSLLSHLNKEVNISLVGDEFSKKKLKWQRPNIFKSRYQSFMRGQSNKLVRNYLGPAYKLLKRINTSIPKELDQLNSLNFSTISFKGFQTDYSFKLFTGEKGLKHCHSISQTKVEKKFLCKFKDYPAGYLFVFSKNSEKEKLNFYDKKIITYRPTSFLLPYTKERKWEKLGLSEKAYQSLHAYQPKSYQCHLNETNRHCVTSLKNYPEINQVAIEYIHQGNGQNEFVKVYGYSENKFFSEAIFKAADIAIKTLNSSSSPKINRLPASK